MGSTRRVTIDKAATAVKLELVAGANQTIDGVNTSQWLNSATYRSCFCIGLQSTESNWTIEALLPDGSVATVGLYDSGNLFSIGSAKYITMNAMCGLPIRFVADTPQVSPVLWVVLKS